MEYQIGTRVGALMDCNEQQARLFGWGYYQGDEIPPHDVAGGLLALLQKPNPKIVLDSGQVVWGCECWWGPEEKIRAMIAGKEVSLVSVVEARKAANGDD